MKDEEINKLMSELTGSRFDFNDNNAIDKLKLDYKIHIEAFSGYVGVALNGEIVNRVAINSNEPVSKTICVCVLKSKGKL